MERSSSDSNTTAVNALTSFDSNYVATYHPWVKILDTDKNKPVWVPPSVVLPGVIAFNDQVAAEWFAPAGLNRGGLTDVIELKLGDRTATNSILAVTAVSSDGKTKTLPVGTFKTAVKLPSSWFELTAQN